MSAEKESTSTASSGKDSTTSTYSARRSKTMPTDSPTAKFLYTIIKQLDLKCIDWNLVASQLEISNGHAARMRYSRFRDQMEGRKKGPTRPRKATTTKSTKGGIYSCKLDLQKEQDSPLSPLQMVKQESSTSSSPCEQKPYIKADPYEQPIPNLADILHDASHGLPASHPQYPQHSTTPVPVSYPHMTLGPELKMCSPEPAFQPISIFDHGYGCPVAWTPVKAEPQDVSEVQRPPGMKMEPAVTVMEDARPEESIPQEMET